MARKPGPGKCVHCLDEFQIRNWDHVFPRSWYPNSTPLNLEKWQIPTCKKCNSDYGKLEEELFVILAMTVTPNTEASSGIYERALRSVDESLGRGKRDRLARRARKQKVLQSLLRGDEIPNEGIYPGLGERWDRPREDQVAFLIPADYIRRFCEKIVRGITYRESKSFIESPFSVEFYPLNDSGAEPIKRALDRHGAAYARGPGFEVIRDVPPDEPRTAIFKITIFGEFVMYAFVSRA
jgi:hypothetical protein